MTYRVTAKVTHWARGFKVMLLALALCGTTGCSANADDVRTSFVWGPIDSSLDSGTLTDGNNYAPQSHAAQLREELLAPVNRYAPGDKDWREARGADRGPTIIGARLSFGLGEHGTDQLRIGAVRRGANRTYGPQFIFNFNE